MHDKIESRCQSFLPVTVIVLDANHFKDWLQEGHPFACKVYKIAECIYNADNVIFQEPKAVDEQELNTKDTALFNQGINKVQEFLAGADLFRIREQNKMAAFMLHQAAEQALITALKVRTGLHLNTHSIDRLIRCCTLISDMFTAIFPRNNDREERLFQLMQKAYIGARYKEDYKVSVEHLLVLTERVRALEKLVKETCNESLKFSGVFD
jgi:HEPN domain-containing protein